MKIVGILIAALTLMSLPAAAQQYPNKPIRLIIPYSAGGGNDVIARPVAIKLSERLGQSVVVENKPGAQALIGMEYAAKAPADGYTLLVAPSGPLTINPAIYSKLSYSPTRDFVPISLMGEFPLILAVSTKHPFTSVKELVEFAKANPEKANYGASASPFQLAAELFNQKAGTRFQHIPYKGSGDTAQAVANGDVTMTLSDAGPIAGLVQGGRLRALAVTSAGPHPAFPGVPTLMQAGFPDMEITLFSGIVAPAGTPPEIVARLQREIAAIVAEPEIRERFAVVGITATGSTSAEYARRIERDIARWTAVARAANIKAD
jgi:tripartite-type tricarboxylate transporter receptor subunit TctC